MRKELPNSLYRQNLAEQEAERLSSLESSLRSHVARIAELRNLSIKSVKQLESITPEWLEGEIAKSKNSLSTVLGVGGFIPAGISKQFDDEYNKVRKECAQPIASIQSELLSCKDRGISLRIDSEGLPRFNEDDVKAAIDKAATYKFSDEEKELYTLFAEIVETMNKIRQYEQQHGAKKSNIPNTIVWLFNGTYDTRTGELISGKEYEFTPEYFFRLIAFGKLFLRNPEEDDD